VLIENLPICGQRLFKSAHDLNVLPRNIGSAKEVWDCTANLEVIGASFNRDISNVDIKMSSRTELHRLHGEEECGLVCGRYGLT